MDLQILPIEPAFSARVLEDLAVISEDSRSFEELVFQWLSEERSMAFARNDATDEHCVGISFLDSSGGTFVGKLQSSEALKLYRGTALFPADHSEVDDAWIEERNEKLGMHYVEDLDRFYVPPESLGEIIIAYALAPLGYAELKLEEDKDEPDIYLDLVYFESRNMPAWGEEFYLSRHELEKYVFKMK